MSVISGKKILLGVTAGIAAYKTAFLGPVVHKSRSTGEGRHDPCRQRICYSAYAFHTFQK